MTRITISIKKSVEENAETYFERAKKAKRKITGVMRALGMFHERLETIEVQKEKENRPKQIKKSNTWYDQYRFFESSEGFLCVGGRSAEQNERLIKKHLEPDDLVFHTELAGSPFFLVKVGAKKPTDQTIQEAAQATASYSRSWTRGTALADAYYVTPDQVSKTAQPGEHLAKGSFMVRGKRTYFRSAIILAVGMKDGTIIGGPLTAIKTRATTYLTITPGTTTPSAAAKLIKEKLAYPGSVDDIIKVLPAGNVTIAT